MAICLAGACVGSGEGIPDGAPISTAVPTTYAEIQTLVFGPMCAAQCHRGGAAPKGLSLEAGREIPSMVGVPSVEAPGMLRVAPGSPENSYLVVKLAPTDARRVGSRMPRNGPPFVSDAQLRAIKAWIRTGARDDWRADEEIDAGPAFPDAGLADAGAADAGASR